MNKTHIIANWKMNPVSAEEAEWLLQAIGSEIEGMKGLRGEMEVVLCPPFVYLPKLNIAKYKLRAGAQNCFWKDEGAYTGEVSPHMISELGCSYVILGHSERKRYVGETYEMINKKVKAVLAEGLRPVVCIGEKEQGDNTQELIEQMRSVLTGIAATEAANLILVYEPEWAISSNQDARPATPHDCQNSIAHMKKVVQELFDETEVPILYGGSTNSKNIKDFVQAGAAGALVGSASLDAQEFIELVKNAETQ